MTAPGTLIVRITHSVSVMRFWQGKDDCAWYARTPSKSNSQVSWCCPFSFVAQRSRFSSTTESSQESRVAHRGPGRDDSVMLAVVNPIVTNYRESPFNCSGPRRDHADEEVKASSGAAPDPPADRQYLLSDSTCSDLEHMSTFHHSKSHFKEN